MELSSRHSFRHLSDAATRCELGALSAERDPTLYAEGLLNLAQRQEQAGRAELAAELYGRLAQDGTAAAGIRTRAQSHLDALLGRGAFGGRAEFLLRNFAQQASDPTLLFAMGAAGTVFRLTRLGVLSRLATSPTPGLLARLLGAGRVASLAGFAAEAPAFTLAGRLGNLALGREQEWGIRALGRELASSYWVLGGLKLTGAIAGRLANAQSAPLRTALHQGGMLTGILLGHRAEAWAGLRPQRDGATTLVDSLALLLQFNVAGRLGRHAFGENFNSWERQLDLQAEALTAAAQGVPGSRGTELAMGPRLALASARHEASSPPPHAAALFSVRLPESTSGDSPSESPAEPVPEVRSSPDGRTRSVDRDVAGTVKLIQAQGVTWVIDIDTEVRRRELEVWVGDHLLPPGGSLRVRDGETIRLGQRPYVFRETFWESGEEVSAVRPRPEARPRRLLHPYYGSGRSDRFELRVGPFLERLAAGADYPFAEGPQGTAMLRVLRRGPTVGGERFELEVADAHRSFRTAVELQRERVILESHPAPEAGSALLPMFADWLATHTAIRAADWELRDISPEFHDLLGYGLIHSAYSRIEAGEGRRHLVTQPRGLLLPEEFGPLHRAAAERAFQDWAQRRLAQRVPTLLEIEAGAALPQINRLDLEPSMPAILDRLVQARTRFLEIGFGERTETLEAVERRGGIAWGLEMNRVYPEGADREALRSADVDVLFTNGAPFLFYAQHHVALPAALDILRQFPRAEWLVIQAYNPRTPFEILRHAEELNRRTWEPMYFRSAASPAEAPIFPTDWCQRPDTPHAVLIARRTPLK